MRHLGDITKISGHEAPVVDVVIGGSPCQDLSIAGKRAGLAGERSGLYMEQIRIIKEMREADVLRGKSGVDVRPRYMVWENVPGAFSSNGGQDFAAVVEEAIRVADPEAPAVPVPEKGWPTSGVYADECGIWSVAWRVLDAQFWGVPQRRRRIALVADFGGLSAPEILFVRKSVSGNLEPGEQKRKEDAGAAGECAVGAVPCLLKIRGGCAGGGKGALIQDNKSATLSTLQDQTLFQPVFGIDQQGGKGGANYSVDVTPPILSDSRGCDIYNLAVTGDVAASLTTATGQGASHTGPSVIQAVYGIGGASYAIQGSMIGRADQNGPQGDGVNVDVSFTLNTIDRHAVAYGIGSYHSNAWKSDNPYSGVYEADTAKTLDALNCGYPACNQGGMAVVESIVLDDQGGQQISVRKDGKAPTLRAETHGNLPIVLFEPRSQDGVPRIHADISPTPNTEQGGQRQPCVAHCMDVGFFNSYQDLSPTLLARTYKDPHLVCNVKHIVRRLTPLECERLQGFPDGWTDIGEWVDSKGKKHKEADSPRYKALGNSIAIPPWKWVCKRLCACYERDATMASLFDGIGGFPYIWEQLNGKGSCLWASEIEEFPIAVTKLRFGGEDNGGKEVLLAEAEA